MQQESHIHRIHGHHNGLNGDECEQRPDDTQGNSLEQKLQHDEIGLGADGLLHTDDARAFTDADKHDVGDAEAPHKDGKDANEPTPVFHLLKNAVQNGGQHVDLVDREIVFLARPQPAHRTKLLHNFIGEGFCGHAFNRFDHDARPKTIVHDAVAELGRY